MLIRIQNSKKMDDYSLDLFLLNADSLMDGSFIKQRWKKKPSPFKNQKTATLQSFAWQCIDNTTYWSIELQFEWWSLCYQYRNVHDLH